MDRKGKLGVALSIIALIAWQIYYSQELNRTKLAQQQIAEAAATSTPNPAQSTPVSPDGTPAGVTTPAAPAASSAATSAATPTPPLSEPKQTLKLESEGAEWVFSTRGAGIERVTLKGHRTESDKQVSLNEFGNTPIGALTEAYENPVLETFAMEAGSDNKSVIFRRTDPRQISIVKSFTLQSPEEATKQKWPETHIANLEVRITNQSSSPVTIPAYSVRAGSGAPLHLKDLPIYTGFNRMIGSNSKFLDTTWFDGGGFLGFGKTPRPVYSETGGISWIGVTNQYYATILSCVGSTGSEALASRIVVAPADWSATGRAADGQIPYAVEGAMRLTSQSLEPGKEIIHKFAIYAGPREFSRLQALGGGQEDMLDFGMFSIVSRVLLASMNGLKGMLGSYAAAIILLTIVIKLLMWPLQTKSTNSMKRMQELQPKMTALKEKYADDPAKMNQELLVLYKKHGVNPMSGCLPMLIQIPIFFGFYNMLGKAVELRNSPFLWVHDLSQPDTVAHLASYPVNVLPLVMAITMLWQMQLTPKTGDPVQQRMFMFMPLIFIVFCYNFASALSLYWTVQNIFTIVQLTITNRNKASSLQKAAAVVKKN
jgi:YidC/Oxa1 family membrane protein insertase